MSRTPAVQRLSFPGAEEVGPNRHLLVASIDQSFLAKPCDCRASTGVTVRTGSRRETRPWRWARSAVWQLPAAADPWPV